MLQRFLDFYNGPYFMPAILFFGPLLFLLVFGYQPSPPPLPSAKEDRKEKKDTPISREVSSGKGSEGSSNTNPGFNPGSLFGAPGGSNKEKLPPPRYDKFTREELAMHDGTNERRGILVAVKGDIFDVSDNRSTYGPGGGYHMFAGKDASRALAISSLKIADCVEDLSGLTEQQLRVLDDWYKFFQDRYAIIGSLYKK
ncbi:hypothetical protein DSO57_1000215 [Entomophthora muscae]|uniref:Uncharacterized protein n=1 Tax=Entomophthora muscae TaxID=34485 RepID=A0ACC2U7B4_9FUNG|nr:hypothetical protein DSO57_1000215 [Entomophthora muscae]